MSKPTTPGGQKRKAVNDGRGPSFVQKRSKLDKARNVAVQSRATALSTSGELNVASFIKAREFEINALDKSMRKARAGLNSRAFQQVPRHLRRRTASHNVKKVPRRLRRRAEREMRDDNTPTVTTRRRTPSSKLRLRLEVAKQLKQLNQKSKTVRQRKKEAKAKTSGNDLEKHVEIVRVQRIKKNTLAKIPKATSKFQRRQVHKTWLPTHLWHAKRAHMPQVQEPLWRMAIPLSPTEKSYRPSHRAAGARGCIAWDTSYMSTIGCRGTDHALENVLKMLRFSGEGWRGGKYNRWKAGTRFAEGWIFSGGNHDRPICPVKIVWYPDVVQEETLQDSAESKARGDIEMTDKPASKPRPKARLNRKILIQAHPSGFLQLWNEVLRLAKMPKPQVLLEDLRFEIGSIEIVGPGSTEALLGVLKPSESSVSLNAHAKTWTALAGLNNPASLPMNSILSFDISDPRLNHPPKQIKVLQDEASISELNKSIVSWPPDLSPRVSGLFSQKARWLASHLPCQKAVNRRKTLVPPGQAPDVTAKDPQIPVMLLASRPRFVSGNVQGKWTILMPWKCVEPVWRSLMYYPLFSGSTPRFGGIEQQRQIAFEQMTPWFPGDMPGTEAGKAWERYANEERFDAWIRKPPSRRLTYDTIDLGLGRRGEVGRGWACDWEFLFGQRSVEPDPQPQSTNNSASTEEPAKGSNPPADTQNQRPPLTQRQRKAAKAQADAAVETEARRRNTSSPESDTEPDREDAPLQSIDYAHLPPPQALPTLKSWKTAALPETPSLVTVRITLVGRGTPNPTARIYRLPSHTPSLSNPATLSEPPNQPESTLPKLAPTTTTNSSSSNPTSSSLPLGAQQPPASTSTSSPISTNPPSLGAQWLALDPTSSSTPPHQTPRKKTRYNHHSLPPSRTHHPRSTLKEITYLPPNAPQEVIEQYSRKPTPPLPSPTSSEIAEQEKQRLMRELFVLGTGEEEGVKWPLCPHEGDLLGFVTSGGYNLAEGRGTAVGGIWVQRVLEGWRMEEQEVVENGDVEVGALKAVEGSGMGKTKGLDKEVEKRRVAERKQRERERHLCIVRNSGESVGRLGLWEVCE